MAVVFKNNAKTTLASGINSSATSITVSDGSVFPSLTGSDIFFVTFDDGTNNEIVKVTARSGNTLTVVRAQESTTARSFSTGDEAQLRLTAGILGLFSQTGVAITDEIEAYLDANGTTFPDNVKAQFGASNDLQIFHDGSDSFIKDEGQGNLRISSNGAGVEINKQTSEYMIRALTDGAVELYHNNSKKLETTSSGVTVTGGLHVGTVTTGGNFTLDVGGDIIVDADGGDVIFKDDGTEIARFKGEKLGIGISPAEMLDIQSASGDARIRLDAPASSDTEIKFFNDGTAQYTIGHDDATDNFVIGGANVDAPLVNVNKSGVLTANAGVVVDNITIDGQEIDVSSGDLTLDVAGDIFLDADGGNIKLQDGGVVNLDIYKYNSNVYIENPTGDSDIIFQGTDGSTSISALTLDMSNAGAATFNNTVTTNSGSGSAVLGSHLDLGDNQKARFGAGDDLEIYHDSSDSYIKDGGTGNLLVQATHLVLENAAGDKNYLQGVDGDAVSIYYNGSTKLATTSSGVDVTGSITADGLTVDDITIDGSTISDSGDLTFDLGGNLLVDVDGGIVRYYDAGTEWAQFKSSSQDVQIISIVDDKDIIFRGSDAGTYFNALTLDMSDAGAATFNSSIASGQVTITQNHPTVFLQTSGGTTNDAAYLQKYNNDLYLYNKESAGSLFLGTNNSTKVTVDSSGKVGIGTTSPSGELHVSNSSDFYVDVDGTDSAVVFKEGGGNSWRIGNRASGDKFNITQDASSLGTNVRFTIDNGGNVGIGTTSPTEKLTVAGAITTTGALSDDRTSTGAMDFSSGVTRFVSYGASSTDGIFAFRTAQGGASSTERMRIDGSGMLGLGTTPPTDSHGTWSQFFIGQKGSVISEKLGSGGLYGTYVTDNLYVDGDTGNFAYRVANEASAYLQEASTHRWYTVASGSAGAAATLSERMRIDSSGNLALGTSSPNSYSGYTALTINNATTGGLIDLESNGTRVGTLFAIGQAQLNFGTATSTPIVFLTDNNERMRIDSSGNIGVGTTTIRQRLHQHVSDSGANYHAFTNSTTGTGTTDGLVVGISGDEDALIWNHEDEHMLFATNNTERVRIDNSGRLLAGTTSVGARQAHTFARTGSFATEVVQQQTSSGASVLGLTYDGAAPNNTSDYFIYAQDTAGIKHLVRSNGDGYFAGKIGIGVSSPDVPLHIQTADSTTNTTVTTLMITNLSSGTTTTGFGGEIRFQAQRNNGVNQNTGGIRSIAEVNSGADISSGMAFDTGTAGVNSEKLRITHDGKVGIGTNTPSQILNLQADTPFIQFNQTGTDSFAGINFGDSDDANDGQILYDHDSRYMRFQVANNERIRINSSGNVGIGTSSPAEKLHVVGDVRVDTDLYIQPTNKFYLDGGNDTFITEASANNMAFNTAGAERMRIDSSGNVDLIQSNHLRWKHAAGGTIRASIDADSNDNLMFYTGSSETERMRIDGAGTVVLKRGDADGFLNPTGAALEIDVNRNPETGTFDDTGKSHPRLRLDGTSGGSSITFHTADANNTVASERGRFHKDGHFLVNCTAAQGVGGYTLQKGTGGVNVQQNTDSTSGGYEFYVFRRNSTQIGSINQSSTNAVTYNTSSDARLKDVTGSSRGLDVINNLNPVAYNWKADNHADEGLIAQEVEKLVPNAVNQDEDGYYSMDYSKLVTHLVKGMQEQQEQIESLKSEIANLKEK